MARAAFLLPSLLFALASGSAGQVLPPAYDGFFRGFRGTTPDSSQGAAVQDLVVEYDAGRIELISGDLFLLTPIGEATYGAVFVGEGRFSVAAPIPVEAAQLRRFFDADSLDVPIRTAVFFFSADMAPVLFGDPGWAHRAPPREARREIEEALDYVSNDDGWIDRELLLSLLNGRTGFFHAHLAESRDEPIIYRVDPYEEEEVTIARRSEARGPRAREVVAQFHRAPDYTSGRSMAQEALDVIRTPRYDIEVTVTRNMDFRGVARLTVERLDSATRWVPFRLFGELEVDSVLWAGGGRATFARAKEATDLWVDVAEAPGDTTGLTFFYQGDLFREARELWTEVRSSTGWYPVYEYRRPSVYHMTFRTPEGYKIAAVGDRISEEVEEGVVTSVWETPEVTLNTFNIGTFTEGVIDDPRVPSLRVQLDEDAHWTVVRRYLDANRIIPEQRNMAQRVGLDLANSFAFFTDVFGPPTVDRFTATEIPSLHGEAFPGLVLLAWSTFQWTSEEGYDEMFRAHEVAHQWWGIGVEPLTERDRWLAEGFAQFSGLWYMARQRGSLELFLERLEETREEILRVSDRAGSIWLGRRAADSRHPEDYQTIVYDKGAWVLHMLRGLLTDLDTGDDRRFTDLMKDFYTTYRGRRATTRQFQDVAERHFGGSMEWFFRQWVQGTAIPRYTFAHKLDELEGGRYQATVRVRQEGVPDDFVMYVPVRLDFGQLGTAEVRVEVKGPLTQVELPMLPDRPETVEFNPDEAVLAEVGTEGWGP